MDARHVRHSPKSVRAFTTSRAVHSVPKTIPFFKRLVSCSSLGCPSDTCKNRSSVASFTCLGVRTALPSEPLTAPWTPVPGLTETPVSPMFTPAKRSLSSSSASAAAPATTVCSVPGDTVSMVTSVSGAGWVTDDTVSVTGVTSVSVVVGDSVSVTGVTP